MNNESFQQELKEVFLGEAFELLEEAENTILAYEKDLKNHSLIDKLFRLVHTIKGSAYIAQFGEIGDFAHIFETLLSALRDKKVVGASNVIDLLLMANDNLKTMLSAMAHAAPLSTEILDQNGKTVQRIQNILGRDDFLIEKKAQKSTSEIHEKKITEENYEKSSLQKSHFNLPQVKPRFLVVDDEESIVDILCSYLKDLNIDVLKAYNGQEALEIFLHEKIDAIFTDLTMPKLNGIEFIREVREHNEFIPVVFISGQSNRDHFKEFLKIGVMNFIDKPFEKSDVFAVSTQVLHQAQLQKALLSISRLSFEAFVALQKTLSQIPSTLITPGDREKLHDIIDRIREETHKIVTSENLLKVS